MYSADKKINNLKQTNQLKDETVDNWIRTVTDTFERLVQDEIRFVLHHRTEIAINAKIVFDGRAMVAFNEREKVIERLKFTTINLDRLRLDYLLIPRGNMGFSQQRCNRWG